MYKAALFSADPTPRGSPGHHYQAALLNYLTGLRPCLHPNLEIDRASLAYSVSRSYYGGFVLKYLLSVLGQAQIYANPQWT